MKKLSLLLTITVLGSMISCTQASKPMISSSIESPTIVPSFTPTNSIDVSTPTNIVPTALPTLTPSMKCLEVLTDSRANVVSTGVLILSGTENTGSGLVRNIAYGINMETNEKTVIGKPGGSVHNISISPSKDLIAYEEYLSSTQSDNLVITDPSGKKIMSIPWKKEWAYLSSWLDKNRLLLGGSMTSNSGTLDEELPKFFVFNPFTNEQAILQPNLKEVFVAQGFSGLVGRGFNPKLDQVVYLRGDRAFLEPLHYILWDIIQQKSLADFEVGIQPTAFPSWSPNGDKYALAASIKEDIYKTWPAYELYSVSRDGQVTQLTHLSDDYPWVYIEDYSWSPDGRYIAFWFSSWSEEKPGWELSGERYLAVVDTNSNAINNYCILGFINSDGRVPLPVWSPDGKQLVVESPTSDGKSRVELFDLAQQIVVSIDEDKTPVGWMVTQ